MSTYSRLLTLRNLVRISLAMFGSLAQAQELSHPLTPRLGIPATPEQLQIQSVLPDGQGLPAGAGSVDQGRGLYQQQCLACHGSEGRGGINDTLAGGQGSLTTDAPVKTIGSYWPYATTLFAYVRDAMPYTAPGSLSNEQAYALTAYLLYLNQIVPADATLDAATLAAITMPNQSGFQRHF